MYAYIKGELAETNPDHIVIETGGIGYQVFISGQTFEYLPAVGEEIKVYTYLYLREDAMILYGFLTKDDLELFKLLISVSGIGPKGTLTQTPRPGAIRIRKYLIFALRRTFISPIPASSNTSMI